LADALAKESILAFGPSQAAAENESPKRVMKTRCESARAPTAA